MILWPLKRHPRRWETLLAAQGWKADVSGSQSSFLILLWPTCPSLRPAGTPGGVTLPGLRRLLGSTLTWATSAPSAPSGQCASSHLLPTEGRGPETMDPVLGPTPKYAWPGRVWFPLDGACRARSRVASGVLMAKLGERAWQGVGWQCWWAVDDADNSPPGRCMS